MTSTFAEDTKLLMDAVEFLDMLDLSSTESGVQAHLSLEALFLMQRMQDNRGLPL